MINAKEYAMQVHANQRYEKRLLTEHLRSVVEVLSDFGYKGDYVTAGWLCNILINTPVERVSVREVFGQRILTLIEACTGTGSSLKHRQAMIYSRIAIVPEAAVIKVAERIAVVEASTPSSRPFLICSAEHDTFTQHVVRHVPYSMKKRLDTEMAIRRAVRVASA